MVDEWIDNIYIKMFDEVFAPVKCDTDDDIGLDEEIDLASRHLCISKINHRQENALLYHLWLNRIDRMKMLDREIVRDFSVEKYNMDTAIPDPKILLEDLLEHFEDL